MTSSDQFCFLTLLKDVHELIWWNSLPKIDYKALHPVDFYVIVWWFYDLFCLLFSVMYIEPGALCNTRPVLYQRSMSAALFSLYFEAGSD